MSELTYFTFQKAVFASDLSSTARLVALAIASHYNWSNSGEAFPGSKTLSKETGFSLRTIDRARTELTDKGWFSIDSHLGMSNRYTPTIPDPRHSDAGVQDNTNHEPTSQMRGGYVTDAQGVRQSDVGGASQWRTNREDNSEPNSQSNKETKGETETQSLPLDSKDAVSSDSLCSTSKDARPSLEKFNRAPQMIKECRDKKEKELDLLTRKADSLLGDNDRARVLFDDPTFCPDVDVIERAYKALWQTEPVAV